MKNPVYWSYWNLGMSRIPLAPFSRVGEPKTTHKSLTKKHRGATRRTPWKTRSPWILPLGILASFSTTFWFYSSLQYRFGSLSVASKNLLYLIIPVPNNRKTKLAKSWWTQWSILQPKSQIFLSGVGGDQKTCQVGWAGYRTKFIPLRSWQRLYCCRSQLLLWPVISQGW